MTTAPPSVSPRRFDPRTLWSAGLSLAILTVAALLLAFGQRLFGLDRTAVDGFLAAVQESPWAFPAVAVLFSALALTGFPQALLFAGTAAVFGAPLGALYGWGATMVSSALTFGLGRTFGARWVRRMSGERAQAIIRVMQNRGLLASMIVRWTPSAPFIVVNAACGSSGMAYWKFAVGTGIGVIPKILLIAFFTGQIDEVARFLTSGNPEALVAIGALVVAWVLFLAGCRVLYRRLRTTQFAGLAPRTGVSESLSGDDQEGQISLNLKSKAR